MCQDGDDRLPPMKSWHEVRHPVPMADDIRRAEGSRYGEDNPRENEHWQEGDWDKGCCDIEY